MIILPAVDIMGGKPVRLYKGEFSTASQVAANALETAKSFVEDGAKWIHMVDLDGSLKKERVNSDIFLSVAANTPLKVEVGGGIRTMQDIEFYLGNGIERVILGSVALKSPALVKEAVAEYGDKIAVGIDAKGGYAAAEGWTEKSDIYFTDLAKSMEQIGVKTIIYTDISKDGAMKGTNHSLYKELSEQLKMNIIASGGVSSLDDVKKLRALNIHGAIIGKAYYTKAIDLRKAVELAL